MPNMNEWKWAVGLAVVSLILARLPILRWLVYPFDLLNTFVHELSHGVATVLTGGSFHRFEIYANTEGVALTRGGVRWIVASAGYLGSAVVGGLLLWLSARNVTAQKVLLVFGIILTITSVLFVRNFFGIMAALVLCGGLIAAALKLEPRWNTLLLLFIAVQITLNALDSLWDLVRLSSFRRHVVSDAQIMQQATGVPAIIWAIIWSGLSLLILWQAIRLAYVE